MRRRGRARIRRPWRGDGHAAASGGTADVATARRGIGCQRARWDGGRSSAPRIATKAMFEATTALPSSSSKSQWLGATPARGPATASDHGDSAPHLFEQAISDGFGLQTPRFRPKTRDGTFGRDDRSARTGAPPRARAPPTVSSARRPENQSIKRFRTVSAPRRPDSVRKRGMERSRSPSGPRPERHRAADVSRESRRGVQPSSTPSDALAPSRKTLASRRLNPRDRTPPTPR